MVDGAAGCETAVAELLPLCLGASYLSGCSVTTKRSLPPSEVQFLRVGDHFPRERSVGFAEPVVSTAAEFEAALRTFVASYATAGKTEKIRLIVHHWLDGLACWALEDLYLSATTVLQIIAATEKKKAPIRKPSFYKYVVAAGARYGVPTLSHDFKDMRNDLIHDGTLSGSRFSGKTLIECSIVAAEVLNWIDHYIHAAMGLGPVLRARLGAPTVARLNAYSL